MIEEYKGWEIGKFDKEYWVGRDKADGTAEYLTYNPRNGKFNIHNKAIYEETSAWYNSLREAKRAVDLWNLQQVGTKQPEALNFVTQIVKEAEDAVKKHGQFTNCHEGYAVILEEVDELWDEVKKKESDRDYSNMKKELVQIAAMCLKMHDLATIKESEKVCVAAYDAGSSVLLDKYINDLRAKTTQIVNCNHTISNITQKNELYIEHYKDAK